MLDVQMLRAMPPMTKFAVCTVIGSEVGGRIYVAVRGGIADWAIYVGLASEMGIDDVAREGNKVSDGKLIRQLVP